MQPWAVWKPVAIDPAAFGESLLLLLPLLLRILATSFERVTYRGNGARKRERDRDREKKHAALSRLPFAHHCTLVLRRETYPRASHGLDVCEWHKFPSRERRINL